MLALDFWRKLRLGTANVKACNKSRVVSAVGRALRQLRRVRFFMLSMYVFVPATTKPWNTKSWDEIRVIHSGWELGGFGLKVYEHIGNVAGIFVC